MADCVKTLQFMLYVTLSVAKSLRSFASLRMTIWGVRGTVTLIHFLSHGS